MTEILKTPASAFVTIPEYPFLPNWLEVEHPDYGKLAMHYVDEGPREGPVVLMLHGEPSWSFAYRKVIRAVVDAGYRAVAPDHIGFGKSDKLPHRKDYSYQHFVDWIAALVARLDLQQVFLLCQDWGGPIGLRTLSQMPQRFAGVVVANTLLPGCEAPPNGVDPWPSEVVANWVEATRQADDLPVSAIVDGVSVADLGPDVLAAYDAPFPDASYKAAVLEFPGLIPIAPEMAGVAENRVAWQALEKFERPFITAFSDGDPSTKAWETVFRHRVAGARGQPHVEIGPAGHFVQEEQPEALAACLLALIGRSTRA